MDNLRLILFFSLAFILMLLWQAWETDYGPGSQAPSTGQQSSAPAGKSQGSVPPAPSAESSAIPSTAPTITPSAPLPQTPGSSDTAETVSVKTDLYTMEISTVGGNVLKVFLNNYPASLGDEERSFQLMQPQPPGLFIAQSGLVGAEGSSAPTHETSYRATAASYQLADGADQLNVDLVWTSETGVKVTKRFTYQRDSYLVTVQHILENGSGARGSVVSIAS